MKYKTVFIIGAPRSGTTWLQNMLGAHPQVVTSQETDLFNGYIRPLLETWNYDLKTMKERRYKGLPSILTQEDFDEIVLSIISFVYEKIRELKPTASVLLEKNPPYSMYTDLIDRYLPEVRFIHMVRDGRDVVASILAASRGWGHSWAPETATDAARMWKSHVLSAKKAQGLDNRYMEVRYEDLVESGAAELKRISEFCHVEISMAECSEICDRFTFNKMNTSKGPASSLMWGGEARRRFGADLKEPDGFFREGTAGTWVNSLSTRELWCFDQTAGDLLVDLGYDKAGWRRSNFLQEITFALQASAGKYVKLIQYIIQFVRRRVAAGLALKSR